jgi:putative hemolysin
MFATAFTTVDSTIIAVVSFLVVLLAVLSIAETAIPRISSVRAQALIADGHASARALARLADAPERFINSILLLGTICQIGETFLVTILAVRLFRAPGVIAVFVLNVIVVFLLVEALPKTWAVLATDRAALLTARPALALLRFTPLRTLSGLLISTANVLVPGRGLKKGPFVSETELLGIVGAAADDAVIEREERELIASVIEFGDTVAREVMVPRPDMVTVDITETVTAALDLAIEHGYSRLPVIGDSADDVRGVAYTKDLMRAERTKQGSMAVSELVRPAHFIPETKALSRLMREMQAEKFHMALLVDEYGGIAGLITLEDCLEELVGDIVDEYDDELPDVHDLGNGSYVIDGGFSVGDANDRLDLELPDDEFDTVGGFVFASLDRVPVEGDSVEWHGHRFTVQRMDGRRVTVVGLHCGPRRSDADKHDADKHDQANQHDKHDHDHANQRDKHDEADDDR